MIGIFTVVTALPESKSAQLQRDADIATIERQAQLQQEAEARQRNSNPECLRSLYERDLIDCSQR
jgi:hypothetical protein